MKVVFDITVGSRWATEVDGDDWEYYVFPVGGELETREIDNVDSYNDAIQALAETMGDTPYHIWYWDFYKE